MQPQKRLRRSSWLVAIGLLAAAAGCSRNSPVPAHDTPGEVRRIVSLSPSLTETIFLLGLGDRLVAVSTADDYPPAVKHLPKAGTLNSPSVETLLSLRPDLILATELYPPGVERLIRNQGLNLLLLPQRDMNDVYTSILNIGEVTGAAEKARQVVAELQQREQAVTERTGKIPPEQRPRVFIEIQGKPLYTAGPASFLHDLVEKAGGRNVASGLSQPYAEVSSEFVIESNPDFILIAHAYPGSEEEIRKSVSKRLGWTNIRAVREGNIICDIHPDHLVRPGPRLIRGLEELAARLHPVQAQADKETK